MSDRASKASASPRVESGPGGAQSVYKNEGAMSSATTPGYEPRQSPKTVRPTEGHAASMEGASGVPDKIEEGIEPD